METNLCTTIRPVPRRRLAIRLLGAYVSFGVVGLVFHFAWPHCRLFVNNPVKSPEAVPHAAVTGVHQVVELAREATRRLTTLRYAAERGQQAEFQEKLCDDLPIVLMLHPDEGSPGYAEVPHLGTLLPGAKTASPDWAAAAEQLATRVRWDLGETAPVDFRTMPLSQFCVEAAAGAFSKGVSLVFGLDLQELPPAEYRKVVQDSISASTSRIFISSSPNRRVGDFWSSLTQISGAGEQELSDPGPFGLRATLGGFGEAVKIWGNVVNLFHRRTAEEAVYAVLLLIDAVVHPLEAMQLSRPEPNGESIGRAIERCKDEFVACFTQVRCLQSLACLTQCGLADQSCSYRCIVSYQSEAFTDFTLCALQKQNLLNSQITQPLTPTSTPMQTFRGAPLTHEVAEAVLVGHFDPTAERRHSWLVVAGSNPAYEQFALQYQLWYQGSGQNSFWYHPTFLVEALDGRKIWRNRDYRVRRRKTPGMWDFSVLDNGIVSEERWHLLGAADNLDWCVLFYVGAARKAGLAYRGCLLLTRDGDLPAAHHAPAITAAVARAGMKLWELEVTNNPPVDPANPPPLIAPATQIPAPLLVMPA